MGYTLEELKALPLGSLGAHKSVEERRESLVANYTQAANGVSSVIQFPGKRIDGSTFWCELNVTRITIGTQEYLLSVARDITERREAEEAVKRSEEAALRLAQETGVIAEIGRIIGSSLDIEEVYECFTEEVRKLIPFDRILVNLVNRHDSTLITAYAAGMEVSGGRKGVVFPIAGTVTEEMLRTEAPLLFHPESIEEVQNRFPALVRSFQAGLRSRLSVPLIARGELIGSLIVWSKQEKAYGERDISLAQSVASQIAGVIANAQLFRECKRVEKALREYEKVVESSKDMIVVVDRSYRYVLANDAFLKYRRLSREDVVGRSAAEVLDADVFEGRVRKYLDACFQGEVVQYEMKYSYTELGEKDLFVSYFPMQGSCGVTAVLTRTMSTPGMRGSFTALQPQ